MNTNQIRAFLAVAQNLSYVRAAELLYTTQPVISYQIKALENELEIKLFNHNNRNVELTPAGLYFFQQIEPLMLQIDTLIHTVRSINQEVPATINLLVRRLADYGRLTQIVRKYSDAHPLVHIHIITREDQSTRQLLITDEIQMAFCYQYEVDRDHKLQFLPIMESQYYVLVSKTHPLAAYKYLTFDDLKDQKLILANTELHKNPRLISLEELRQKKIIVEPAYTGFDSMLIAVQSGIGFTVLPCSRSKKFSGLIKIPLKDAAPMALGIAWHTAHLSPMLETFIDMTRKQAENQFSQN